MGRTLLRLLTLTLPLLAMMVVWESASGPMPTMWWPMLCILSPFIVAAIMLSFLEAKDDAPTGVVPRRARRGTTLLWIVSVGTILSVVQTEWPLHLSFRASKPLLKQMVTQSRQNKPLKFPQEIGMFNVTHLEADDEVIIFYLDGADNGDGAKIQYWFSPGAEVRQQKARWKNDAHTIVLDENWILYAAL